MKRAGIPNAVLGFIGGLLNLSQILWQEEEIETRFVHGQRYAYQCVKTKLDQETGRAGTGPSNVEPAQLEELKAILYSLTAEDAAVFAGSR